MHDDEVYALREAAACLRGSKRLLISTGAGMSADSGIPTYRDTGGRWREYAPFAEKGLRPADFAHVKGLRERPANAWAFYEHMRRVMARSEPHPGYGVVTRWLTEGARHAFLLTTNIDGLHLRAGVPDAQLCERYGSLWELQCLAVCTPQYWPDRRVPLCTLDPERMEATDLPQCPYCGGLARPRIQTDFDEGFLSKDHDWRRYENFLAAGEPDTLLVIGTTLWFSWPDGVARPRVVSINPDPATHAHYPGAIGITMGARDALVGLDWFLARG